MAEHGSPSPSTVNFALHMPILQAVYLPRPTEELLNAWQFIFPQTMHAWVHHSTLSLDSNSMALLFADGAPSLFLPIISKL